MPRPPCLLTKMAEGREWNVTDPCAVHADSADSTSHPPQLSATLVTQGVTNSPRLSRKARDEAVAVNETNGDDPDNYPLNTPWTFWHDM